MNPESVPVPRCFGCELLGRASLRRPSVSCSISARFHHVVIRVTTPTPFDFLELVGSLLFTFASQLPAIGTESGKRSGLGDRATSGLSAQYLVHLFR